MESAKGQSEKPVGLSWLADVRNVVTHLSVQHPVWVRSMLIRSGPAVSPESHPNYELCFIEKGAGVGLVGHRQMEHAAGDLLLYGPGLPHWFRITRYPFKFTAVHFLPNALFELAPENEAARIVCRFTASQDIANLCVRPTPSRRRWLRERFDELNKEFTCRRFGWETKLWVLLLEIIVELMRWEQANPSHASRGLKKVNWMPIERALRFLREHVAEPIYARNVAAAAGISESRMKVLFRDVLGTSWSHFLRGYRLHLAAAKLAEPGHNIVEIAQSVGFENQSYFSAAFHALMGVSPREYARRVARSAPGQKKRA